MPQHGEVVDLKARAAALTEYWSPVVVSQVNDQYVKVARVKGELTWHQHEHEDELFLVLEGTLHIAYTDHEVTLKTGECHLVPRGVMHNPHCEEDCLIALFESVTTRHTGDKVTEKTKSIAAQLADGNV